MPMIGMTMFSTNDVTRAVNAVPITTATARSMTLPRVMNFLKSARSSRTHASQVDVGPEGR